MPLLKALIAQFHEFTTRSYTINENALRKNVMDVSVLLAAVCTVIDFSAKRRAPGSPTLRERVQLFFGVMKRQDDDNKAAGGPSTGT